MKQAAVLLTILIALLTPRPTPALAQEQTPESTETSFSYGAPISGTLNDATPLTAYTFDGLRGDVIAIDLTVNAGTLDPVLTLLDSSGSVIAQRDDAAISGRGSRDLHLESLHIPRSDHYSLVVARFGSALGSTAGQYTLAVDRIGVSSASGSALRYGDSVYNTITDAAPQVYYSFRAARGDVISVRMQRASGDLDPALQIVNSDAEVIAENDDSPGTLDAAINGFIIREDGVYVIIASRFGQAAGRSKGSFALTFNAGAESGLGRSIEFALPILPGIPVQGSISDDNSVQFYSFQGKRDDVITIRMNRSGGALDAYVALLDPSQREISSDDDGGGGQNARIDRYALPADGTYTIVASRFDRAQGTTVGAYQLQLDVVGSASQGAPTDVPRIEIDSTVSGEISDDAPQQVYAFVGQAGDVLSIAMDRVDGNLDPRLAILNAQQNPLTSDDDSGGEQNARISFTVPATGLYYIVATRYGGTNGNPNTAGTYLLTLAQPSN